MHIKCKMSMEIGVHRLKKKISSFRTGFLCSNWLANSSKWHYRVDGLFATKKNTNLSGKSCCFRHETFSSFPFFWFLSTAEHNSKKFNICTKRAKVWSVILLMTMLAQNLKIHLLVCKQIEKWDTNLADWMAALEPPPLFCLLPWFV